MFIFGYLWLAYLDKKWMLCVSAKHPVDRHACHLAGDNVLGHPESNFLISLTRQEVQQIMIDAIQVPSMLPRIVQPCGRDLWKLTGS